MDALTFNGACQVAQRLVCESGGRWVVGQDKTGRYGVYCGMAEAIAMAVTVLKVYEMTEGGLVTRDLRQGHLVLEG